MSARTKSCILALSGLINIFSGGCALAQVIPTVPVVPTGPLPTDVTPIRLREERELLRPGPSLYLFQQLPSNLWFNTSSEVNLRYESNVFLTATQPKRDIVFRTFPNMTVGYNFLKNTGVYTNYFMIKDVYADTAPGIVHLTLPTTQSLSLGFRHNRQIRHTNVQFDFQSRELWQNRGLRQFDYIPGMLLTRSLTPHTYGFINLQLQMRGGTPFVAPTRELDPFYTIGVLRSFGLWTLSVTDTFITDFRDPPFKNSIPQHSNVEMISDIEIYHPIVKRYPNVVGFLRAEPIWNWHSNRTPGLSGFDFRLYSGIRVTFAKPAIGGMVNQMRKEVQEDPANKNAGPPGGAAPGQPIPNSSVPAEPGPRVAEAGSSGSNSPQALANRQIETEKSTKKNSLFQKLLGLAGPANAQPAQSPIIMIQNTMNPFGPMIPTLAPQQPPNVVSTAAPSRKIASRKQQDKIGSVNSALTEEESEHSASFNAMASETNYFSPHDQAPDPICHPVFNTTPTAGEDFCSSGKLFKQKSLLSPELLTNANFRTSLEPTADLAVGPILH